MDFGQWSALAVLVGIVLAAVGSTGPENVRTWKRDVLYFGTGVLFFGLVSCVLIAAGVDISIS